MNPIATLFVEIGADLGGLHKGLQSVESSLKQKAASIGSIASSIGGTLVTGAALGGVALVGLGALVGKAGIDFNAMKESALTAFTTMLGDGKKAADLMENLQKFAADTPFEFNEIAGATKKLLAFGVKADDVTETLRRVGDISSGIGAPIGEIAELYGKAKVQGRLFAEDINQLTGRGIPIIQELAKQFGVSDSEVKQLIEDGKVGFPNLEQAFKDLTSSGGQFSGMMEAQSKTFGGMMSTLMDNFNQLAGELTAPIFDVLKEGLSGLLALMDTPAFKQGIKDFAKGIATGVKFAVDAIVPFIKTVFMAGQQAGDTFPKIQQFIGAMWNFIRPILQAVFDQLSIFWKEIQPKLVAAWDNILRVTQQVFGAIAQFISDHATEIRAIFSAMWAYIEAVFTIAWAVIKGIVKIALDLLAGDFDAAGKDYIAMMSEIWNVIQRIIRGAWDGIVALARLALVALGTAIADKMQEMKQGIVDRFGELIGWLQSLPSQFFNAGSEMIQALINGFWNEATAIQDALAGIINQALNNALTGLGLPPIGNMTTATSLMTGNPTGATTTAANVNVNFYGQGAPSTPQEANQSAGMLLDALAQKGMAF